MLLTWYEGQKKYWSSSAAERASADALYLANLIEGSATYAPFGALGGTGALKQIDVFGLNQGYGVFGKSGLNIGNYKLEALYASKSGVGGTILSFKQNKVGAIF